MLRLFALILLGVAPSPSGGSFPADLIGKWESVTNLFGSHSMLEWQLELRADGSLVSSTASVTEARYRVTGLNLLKEFLDPYGKVMQVTSVLEIRGDKLRETASNGRVTEMTRAAPEKGQGGAPIVGVWTYRDPEFKAGLSSVTFLPDGRMILRVPMKLDTGTWKASSDKLTYSLGKQEPETVGYRRVVDLLTILSNAGQKSEFRRVVASDRSGARP